MVKQIVATGSVDGLFPSEGDSPSTASPNALSKAEIDAIIAKLPAGTSQQRIDVVRYALESVGRIPYYWPDPHYSYGIASKPGYEGNNFGSTAPADPKGRTAKGLDRSHWVDWVYWSTIGDNLGNGSTWTLKDVGKKIGRSELRPGDIVVDNSSNAHTAIFLYWDSNGNMVYVHENASAQNVSISSVANKHWEHYRSVLD
jgi:hypothetical protein